MIVDFCVFIVRLNRDLSYIGCFFDTVELIDLFNLLFIKLCKNSNFFNNNRYYVVFDTGFVFKIQPLTNWIQTF